MARRVVLVTGAGGFIGRGSLPELARRGFEIHAVRPAPGADGTPHDVNLLDPVATGRLIAAVRPTHLLHFAWIATPGAYWTSADNARWLDAGRALLREFLTLGGVRVVMAGSCAEYDWSRAGVCSESGSPLADADDAAPSPYASCKLAMSRELSAACNAAGASGAWGRIFFQYGPHEHPRRLVPDVIRSLLAGREAHCSAGTQVRSFLHVADVGGAFAALLDSEVQGAVNIGAAERLPVAGLIDVIARQIGRRDLVRLGTRPAPAGEPALLVPDVTRLRDELGWRPRFGVEDGVADTIAWWRAAQ